MARGYPDYFGISAWPRYGTPVLVSRADMQIPDGATIDLIDVSCQGILYGMQSRMVYIGDVSLLLMHITVDGVIWDSYPVTSGTVYQGFGPSEFPFSTVYDDRVGKYIEVVLSREIPFRQSLKIQLLNFTGDEMNNIFNSQYYQVS